MQTNNGIINTGGSVAADVLVVGHRARAATSIAKAAETLQAEGRSDAKARLERLLVLLDAKHERLQDPSAAYAMTERVAGELAKPKPDKITLKSLITQIVEETKSVAEIASAAIALKEVVGRFI